MPDFPVGDLWTSINDKIKKSLLKQGTIGLINVRVFFFFFNFNLNKWKRLEKRINVQL